MNITTDGQGKFSLTVLSSDTVCNDIKVKVKHVSADAGSQSCDFADSESLRRFGLLQFPDEKKDTGWIFDSGILSQEDETTPAKIYLKFQKDLSILRDTKYFNNDGTLRTNLSDNGNWSFVNGHVLRIHIKQVIPQDGATIDGALSEYATLIDQNGNTVESLDVTTANDGAAQFRLKAGPLINNSASILLEAQDLTQK